MEKTLDINLLEVCSRCGACYHICPSCLNIEGYDPRLVIKDILAGRYEHWLNSLHIWQCLECHHCLEICFQYYGFENAMTAMRTLAIKKGILPQQVKKGIDMFFKTGKLGDPNLSARKRLGLPEAPKGGMEDFKEILKIYEEAKIGNRK
ncbi:MAG: 4Fe-4S dicluster domain-containing protein [Deltaproteobacteria bacterium]|nr:4Fe-4S dicluster domain-containing protein [Deltaproteobacteria bacterium]